MGRTDARRWHDRPVCTLELGRSSANSPVPQDGCQPTQLETAVTASTSISSTIRTRDPAGRLQKAIARGWTAAERLTGMNREARVVITQLYSGHPSAGVGGWRRPRRRCRIRQLPLSRPDRLSRISRDIAACRIAVTDSGQCGVDHRRRPSSPADQNSVDDVVRTTARSCCSSGANRTSA